MTAHWIFAFLGLSFSVAASPQIAQLPELHDVDLRGWDCLAKLEGAAKTQNGRERNEQKNRSPVDLAGIKVQSFDLPALLARFAEYDRQIGKSHRRYLTPEEKTKLLEIEKQIVSVTGWLVLAYRSPIPESTNCRSQDFQDWHLELSPAPADHPAQIGDPTPIVCEITPRTEGAVYHSGIRIQKLAAFFRLPDNSFVPTGSEPHKIRVTGFLLWDDEHNQADADIGSSVGWFSKEGYHHPWRASGWEIHPVLKVEDLGTK
jgi:hypothetical protein